MTLTMTIMTLGEDTQKNNQEDFQEDNQGDSQEDNPLLILFEENRLNH